MKRVKTNHPDSKEIFINAINDNQVIAYPTDTIYGLGTAINNDEGIEKKNKYDENARTANEYCNGKL